MRPSSWIVEYWEVPRQNLGTGAQMSKQKRYIRPKSEKDINKRFFYDYKAAARFAQAMYDSGGYQANIKSEQTLKPEINLTDARKLLEEQFRIRLYKDPKYPFLPAMGTRHMFQTFNTSADDTSWRKHIGTLHLWWSNESGEPTYQTKDKQFISGYWKSEWIDDPAVALKMAIEIEREQNKYAEELTEAHLKDTTERSEKIARKMLDKRFKNDMQKATEESEKVLWNQTKKKKPQVRK